MRLLEKNLADMSLKDKEDRGPVNMDDISEDKSNVSKETENSEDTQKGMPDLCVYCPDANAFSASRLCLCFGAFLLTFFFNFLFFGCVYMTFA